MQMLRARCHDCGWEYDCVALPMPMADACRAMAAACCPMCGNRDQNAVAPPRQLTAPEATFKADLVERGRRKPPPSKND